MEVFEGEKGFLDRELNETRYVSRLAKEYLGFVCDPKRIWVSTGQLTAMLRRELLGKVKTRDDHRHHALDAAVIGVSERALLAAVAREAAHQETLGSGRILGQLIPPWPTFREDVLSRYDDLVVSHKQDHNVQDCLHNDTAYGIIRDAEGNPHAKDNAVHRKSIDSFASLKDIQMIRDDVIRRDVEKVVAGLEQKQIKKAVAVWGAVHGVRGLRVVETLSLIPVRDASGLVYKGYKGDGNAYMEIFRRPDGRWADEVVSTFDANQPGFVTQRQRQSLPLVMRLFKNDMIAVQEQEQRRILRVVQLSPGQICLADHSEAGNLRTRHRDKDNPFSYLFPTASGLQRMGARKVWVNILGNVKDPGPRK